MAETYCGKTCLDCAQREKLSCPGCKTGPGRRLSGDCELARCCREKGHETCATCGYSGNCGTLRGRERIPEKRQRCLELEAARRTALLKRAPVLGKWLWVLFWLFIPASVGALLSNENVVSLLPGLYMPGVILSGACSLVYAAILLRLSRVEETYKGAGICMLIGSAVGLLTAVLSGGGEMSGMLLLSIPASVVSIVGECKEYTAHSYVLADGDNVLAERWSTLRKWYIGAFCGTLGAVVLAFMLPLLGAVLLLASAVVLLVVSIVKLVYLYRTAKVFRACGDSAEETE